ncbi:unnamed protein product [Dicrocoelium dendriticum]|nr:unnamed protein product [Dicrocoelium dendriticum]
MRIVLTGFAPFGSNAENASSIAVRTLEELWNSTDKLRDSPINLTLVVNIPVTYRDVLETLQSIWSQNPDLVVHVGVNAHIQSVALETRAFNGIYDHPGVDHCSCDHNGLCIPDGADVLCCQLDLNRTFDVLVSKALPVVLSDNPGLYLCGFIYYLSLSRAPDRSVFIHVPPVSSNMTARDLAVILFEIIQDLGNQLGLPVPNVTFS